MSKTKKYCASIFFYSYNYMSKNIFNTGVLILPFINCVAMDSLVGYLRSEIRIAESIQLSW